MITETFSSGFYMLITTLFFALAIDLLIGEFPSKIHPVVIIGKFIDFFKAKFINLDNKFSGFLLTLSVVISTLIFILIPLLISKEIIVFNEMFLYLFKLVAVLLLSSSFSVKILLNSVKDIESELKNNNLKKAREKMSYLVSRNTSSLTKENIISASIETMSENIPDSYVSTVFYYCIIGIISALLGLNDYWVVIIAILSAFTFRAVNTLDAMVGYKTNELKNIGWFPAHLDDILNFIPARLSAIIILVASFALKFDWKHGFFIMNRDAKNCDSPNSGYTMASIAGALNIQLEKKDYYIIGDYNSKLDLKHIEDAVNISKFTIALATMFFILILLDFYLFFI